MGAARTPPEYRRLVRKHRPRRSAAKSAEQQLDALLSLRDQRATDAGQRQDDAKVSALDELRAQMRQELIPVFEDLQNKYEPAGILIAMDASKFLAGGVELVIEVQYERYGMRLVGTATPDGFAFHEARFSNDVPGVMTTGPMLRARTLTGTTFRDFICERVAQLVRLGVPRGHASATRGSTD